jgi:hypothetical protein
MSLLLEQIEPLIEQDTPASVHDKHPLPDLRYGQEQRVRRQRLRQPEGADRIEGTSWQGLH